MDRKKVLLISQGAFEKDFLESIAEAVTNQLNFYVDHEEASLDLSAYYDPSRRQYDGNGLLHEIESISSPGYFKKIGLFRVDLFIPILTYIFGQAIFNGDSGIASLYRLRNEQYGLKKDDTLLRTRFIKVIIHELGHSMGLIHCHNPVCVMRSSTYVEDIDQKSRHFCNSCREKIMNCKL